MERLGVPPVAKDARKQRVFSAGHIFHEWIQAITEKAGLSIAQELELQDEDLMIRGHIDDLILIPALLQVDIANLNQTPIIKEPQHLILYDYKTVNSRSFIWAKKKDEGMSHFHKMQLGTYMYMLRKDDTMKMWNGEQGEFENSIDARKVSEARILKIEKDNLMMMEQQLLWSPELEKEVVGYWRTLNGYWKNKKLPKCTCELHAGGFMAKEAYNPYFYEGEPCSLKYYELCKKEGKLK